MNGIKLYADAPARRARQLLGDLSLVLWIVAWWTFARLVHGTVMLLARPGEEIESAGNGLADRLRDAGSAVGDAPLLGDELESPFSGAGDAAERLAGAGTSQVEAVEQLATWLAFAVGAIPILLALAVYVPHRWRFVREATGAQRFIDSAADLDLFALRALAHQPMHRLAGISDDPAAAWRAKDSAVIDRLALLELGDVGLRPPRR